MLVFSGVYLSSVDREAHMDCKVISSLLIRTFISHTDSSIFDPPPCNPLVLPAGTNPQGSMCLCRMCMCVCILNVFLCEYDAAPYDVWPLSRLPLDVFLGIVG